MATGHQHLPIGEQRGRVTLARGAEAAGWRPFPRGGIVEFRAVQGHIILIEPTHHEDPAVGQQGGGVGIAREVEVARGGPGARSRVVQHRTGQGAENNVAPGDEHLAVG